MGKKLLLTVLVFAMASFAMKYSGNVFVNLSDTLVYVSPGCSSKNEDGIITKKGADDFRLKSRDDFGWYKIPVKKLLVGDTLAPFCFYNGKRDTMKVVTYDEDSTKHVKKVLYYYSTGLFDKDIFENQESVYIDMQSLYLGMYSYYYKTLNLPKLFLKTDWKKTFVNINGYQFTEVVGKPVDGWTVISDIFKNLKLRAKLEKRDSTRSVSYTVKTHCLKDEEGECVYDEDALSYVMVKDTTDSIVSWSFLYDTLAVDTIFNRVHSSSVTFADAADYCGSHFITATAFNVGGNVNDDYFCYNSKWGISLSDTTLYIFENPKKEHETLVRTTKPEDVKYLHVLPPQVSTWFGETPILSTNGGKTEKLLKNEEDHCGWYKMLFFEEDIPTKATFYANNSRSLVFGKNTNLDSLYKKLKTNELYYVAGDAYKKYWYAEDPEYEGICYVHLQGIVYDTDAELHPAFSCYSLGGEGCQMGAQGVDRTTAFAAINECIGIVPGIVADTLGEDHKPVLTNEGKKCFISSELFDQLFNPTEGVNETSCSTIPFTMNSFGKWEFASDYYTSFGTKAMGGYYPVEETMDEDIVVGTPVVEARTKRSADGPVFLGSKMRELDPDENVMKMNLLCSGPAWKNGADCSGLFADGDDLAASGGLGGFGFSKYDCVWGWSCPNEAPVGWPLFKGENQIGSVTDAHNINGEVRWSGERNQHFCFESHAKFVYKKGQRFGVRGDDDIWIYIAGKLAIDLGGTHLAAPGYADLDNFTDKNGDPLEVGNTYDIDIFFCDRRTTMSNMNFYSNIYLDQSEVIDRMKPCKVEVEHIFDDDPLQVKGRIVANVPKASLHVAVEGLHVEVSGLVANEPVALLDVQGRFIANRVASSEKMHFDVRNAGRYIVKTRTGSALITVK